MFNSFRFPLALIVFLFIPLACTANGNDDDDDSTPSEAPVLLAERAHDPVRLDDFLRLAFLPEGTEPSGKLGAPDAAYVFVGSAEYYRPALKLADVPQYGGLTNWDEGVLLAMVCRQDETEQFAPVLATWPNVFALIADDLGDEYSCPAVGDSPENRLLCLAESYTDTPDNTAVVSLANALSLALELFADADIAATLQSRYGIYPEFSGLGYSVKTYGDYDPMSAEVVLKNSLAPEYLVKNIALSQADCACIKVAPYNGRGEDPLDPDFIRQMGDTYCKAVDKLQSAE